MNPIDDIQALAQLLDVDKEEEQQQQVHIFLM